MEVNEAEREAAKEDRDGAEVVARPPIGPQVDVADQWDPEEVGEGLGALDVAPGPGKVPRPHFLIDEHLESVIVSSNKETVNPNKRHVSVITLKHHQESCKMCHGYTHQIIKTCMNLNKAKLDLE